MRSAGSPELPADLLDCERDTKMIEIDGSKGEGGGQIIRSSLALSAVTGKPICVDNIRAKRSKPGLMRQHLTAVRAVAQVCNAAVEGAELGASRITFEPQSIRGGDFQFQVGTAGSTSLIAQSVLPALMLADEPSTVTLEGGTHNPWAPPFDFLQRVYLPQLAKMGPQVQCELESYGFYPAGGGKIRLEIQPCENLNAFKLLEREGKLEPRVTALVSGLPASVGDRECDTIRRKSGWRSECFQTHVVERPQGPGNVVLVELKSGNVTEMVSGVGKVGVKAEQVARQAYRTAKAYLESNVPVGEYLADQLMMPMGLAASRGQSSEFRTMELSMHSQTHLDVLKRFLDIETSVVQEEAGSVVVRISPGS